MCTISVHDGMLAMQVILHGFISFSKLPLLPVLGAEECQLKVPVYWPNIPLASVSRHWLFSSRYPYAAESKDLAVIPFSTIECLLAAADRMATPAIILRDPSLQIR